MEKKKRLQKRVKRIDDRFIKKGGQTDMDIAEHEARLKRLADKGGFTPPHEGWHSEFLAKSPLNQVKGFEKIEGLKPAQGYLQQKISNVKGKLKENKKEIGVIGAVATSMIPLGGVIKAAQGLRVAGKSAKAMKGIVDKLPAKAKTFLEKEKFSKRAKTFLEKEIKRSKPGKSGITKSSQREMLHGKPRYPSSRNLMKSSKNATPTKTSTVTPKPKQQYKAGFEGEVLEPKSGYYSTDGKGWPMPLGNKLAEKAARKIKARNARKGL